MPLRGSESCREPKQRVRIPARRNSLYRFELMKQSPDSLIAESVIIMKRNIGVVWPHERHVSKYNPARLKDTMDFPDCVPGSGHVLKHRDGKGSIEGTGFERQNLRVRGYVGMESRLYVNKDDTRPRLQTETAMFTTAEIKNSAQVGEPVFPRLPHVQRSRFGLHIPLVSPLRMALTSRQLHPISMRALAPQEPSAKHFLSGVLRSTCLPSALGSISNGSSGHARNCRLRR